MSNTFTCAICGVVAIKGRSDEEAQADYEAVMPEAASRGDDTDTVCDSCHADLMQWARREGIRL